MQVKIKKLHPRAQIPTYATDGAGAFDLHAISYEKGGVFCTGLAFEVPKDHVMLVFGRSGFAFNKGAGLSNGVGVIDSDYRGEVKVKYNNYIDTHEVGDRIAQAMIIPVERVDFLLADTLTDTDRGANGFGSTGV